METSRNTNPAPGSRSSETLAWLAAASGFDLAGERKIAGLASVASVYADLCAPRGASLRQHDLVARFTLLFFLVDDASEGEVPDLLASDAPWSIGRYTDALREVKLLMEQLPSLFNWVILDTPPLLFAADANLLSTLCHGTILVVRIGATTIDAITRAMQSLCQNNVLGIVVNGARRGELYSKYTYYHSYYQPKEEAAAEEKVEPPAESTD